MSYKNWDAKPDANQKQIVSDLRKFGAVVLDTRRLKNAFDILVGYNELIYIMEIKNPEYLKDNYTREDLEKKLSDGERKCMKEWQSVGVTYHIVATSEEAIQILKGK